MGFNRIDDISESISGEALDLEEHSYTPDTNVINVNVVETNPLGPFGVDGKMFPFIS